MFGLFNRKKEKKGFNITSRYGNFIQKENETVLESALRQNILLPHNCRVGTCRRCEVFINGSTVLACQFSSDSDITLEYNKQWHKANIDNITQLGDEIIKVSLFVPSIELDEEQEGQYVDLTFDKQKNSQRKYSIVSINEKNLILHVKKHPYGEVSNLLANSRHGQEIFISQPQGEFRLPNFDTTPSTGLAIATGSGMGVALTLLDKLCSKYLINPTIISASRKKSLGKYHDLLISDFKQKYPITKDYCMNIDEVNNYLKSSQESNATYIVCGTPELNKLFFDNRVLIEKNRSSIVQESF
ncbi:2Fe-2S iron-sulfur cluster binding domain-containing protein [Xenorhabdus sp. Vera]|uniref:2Fe-2S iron-sulfur cluster binding domain-containing protein n=1 Tax=Xenorhabdus koppenhoeferi TaxID=351659 RepID=UPI0019A6CB70|nr:2Fe-2S iron-sulfur cluster binding domain-containing protein [Xenorhabdus sp. Vera]MBD2809612.1 2Fe-2S iron-sulfur cluster binding domain-containing protein [Xenorhabdus sp. Vera]